MTPEKPKLDTEKLSINWSPKKQWLPKKSYSGKSPPRCWSPEGDWPSSCGNQELRDECVPKFDDGLTEKEYLSIQLNIDHTPKMRAEMAKRRFLKRRIKTSFENTNDHLPQNSSNGDEIIKVVNFLDDDMNYDEYPSKVCNSARQEDWNQVCD